MKEFRDKVAVITGAASGIGRSIAERCVQEGMKVVLADIEEAALIQTANELKATGASVLPVRTDVSKANDVEALAQQTLSTFGSIHLLVNNAGVGSGSTIWESSLADWQWVLGVNLCGVIHGLRTFVPIMLKQDIECQIVNMASLAGLLPYHPSAPYQISKHGIISLSEHLYHSLAQRQAKIKVCVVCPGGVSTRLVDAARNRPTELRNPTDDPSFVQPLVDEGRRQGIQSRLPPQKVADDVFKAIREEQFYVLTHPNFNPLVQTRMDDILQQRLPEPFKLEWLITPPKVDE
jgi:NAD(P)-dependent dehydrogenase (short-subunit alcohol dehydrogenase family)